MQFRRTLAVAGLAAAVSFAASAGLPATLAKADTTSVQLPISTYSHMLVDPVHQHIFFTSGSGSSSILVTDYSGNTVATIPGETGATGLALSSDGGTVYAALSGADAVSAISTSTLTETARYATGTSTDPYSVAYTAGKIWFSYGSVAGQGGIGSIDPSASPANVTLGIGGGYWYGAPMLAASANGELVAGETGQSPDQIASYDVASGTATVLAPETYIYSAANLGAMAITPDGNDVVVSSGAPYEEQIFKVSDLSADGTYQTAPYPNSVGIASDGTVAAGSKIANEVWLFAPGGTSPVSTYDFSSWLAADGVAITPDARDLFAVTTGDPYGGSGVTLNIVPNPALISSTLSLTGPATARHGDTVTFSGSLGGPSAYAGGQTLTVTRTDPSDPNGVTLPSVTTAADGSFSFTDTAPKTTGQDTSTVTYRVSYAGDSHLTASTASASVTVDNTGS